MKSIVIAFLLTTLSLSLFAQDPYENAFSYEVHKVYPAFSTTKEELKSATTLVDLNRFYESDWVETYNSVTIAVLQDGNMKTVVGLDDTITPKQKDLMLSADPSSQIHIEVKYMPKNSLTENEERINDWSVSVEPGIKAKYVGGEDKLSAYLKEHVIDQLPEDVFVGYKLAVVEFTIDQNGQVVDARVHTSAQDDTSDKLMLDAICKMPAWSPAEYIDGPKVKQTYAFCVGNMKSCVVNTLNMGINNF